MKDILSKFESEVFELKEAWRSSKKSLTILVPIVTREKTSRNYVVLDEVKDKVTIEDTGGIHGVRVNGPVKKPTFIRGGTMLKGSTQGRATQFGLVVVPSKSMTIPVHCIHASKGIRHGARLTTGGYAPFTVYSSILSERTQNNTWSEVAKYSTNISLRSQEVARDYISRSRGDDLIGVVETFHAFQQDLKEALKQIPDYIDQVGTIVIDPEGILGLEVYDHPDSWKAFSEGIIRSYSEALTQEDQTGIFTLNMDAATPLVHRFLKNLANATEEEVYRTANTTTTILRIPDYVGEYTVLDKQTIHITVTRRKPHPTSPNRRSSITTRRGIHPSTPRSPSQRLAEWGSRFKRKMQKGRQILGALREQPKTWTSLRSEVPMSKATLSSRLRELQELDAVEKQRTNNGVTRYGLTAIGHEFLGHKSPPSRPPAEPRLRRQDLRSIQYDSQLRRPRESSQITPCPKCNSHKTYAGSFNLESIHFTCQKCYHKWREPRR